ncbi:MAG: hypothetical protein CSB19_01805 [Clostridiales bacterium]|nr:MAG: hypothetical protein CSB19_01805 [Clostridiales bacterium]
MTHLKENVSYLRGLVEGLEIKKSKDGKVFHAIIDALDEMAVAINALNEDIKDLDAYIDAIDEDLTDLEDDFYDEVYDESYDDLIDEDELYEGDDEVVNTELPMFEFEGCECCNNLSCPECGEMIYIEDPSLYNPDFCEMEVSCPMCGANIRMEKRDRSINDAVYTTNDAMQYDKAVTSSEIDEDEVDKGENFKDLIAEYQEKED